MSKKKPKLTLTVYMLCKNKLIKDYIVMASRKFNIGDETYVIKKECCYPRIQDGYPEIVAYYVEGNPNPFDLKNIEKNNGLKSGELENYIAGDVFNIIMECRKKDKTRYILGFAVLTFLLGLINFISWIIFR